MDMGGMNVSVLSSSYFLLTDCQRPKCPLKNDSCLERCYKEGIIYQAVCTRCHQEQEEAGVHTIKDSLYIGESSRTLYTRYQQHIWDYKRAHRESGIQPSTTARHPSTTTPVQDPLSSWMLDHSEGFHGGPSPNLLSTYRDPMSRQENEAVRINRALDHEVHTTARWKDVLVTSLNRRGECFAPIERWDKQKNNNCRLRY